MSWHSVDLADADAAARLSTAFDGVDTVVHLAWGFQPSHDIDYLYRLGVGGTAAVLQAAADGRRAAPDPHVLGRAPTPRAPGRRVDESAAREGIASLAYSLHKAEAERLLDTYEREAGERGHADQPAAARLRGAAGRRQRAAALRAARLRAGQDPDAAAGPCRWTAS